MSLMALMAYVTRSLRSQRSLTLDAAEFAKHSQNGDVLNRITGNRVAAAAIESGAARFATLELFQNPETWERSYYMIFARSRADWLAAVTKLQQRVIAESAAPAEIGTRIVVDHPHG